MSAEPRCTMARSTSGPFWRCSGGFSAEPGSQDRVTVAVAAAQGVTENTCLPTARRARATPRVDCAAADSAQRQCAAPSTHALTCLAAGPRRAATATREHGMGVVTWPLFRAPWPLARAGSRGVRHGASLSAAARATAGPKHHVIRARRARLLSR